jgi:hypothetical protein
MVNMRGMTQSQFQKRFAKLERQLARVRDVLEGHRTFVKVHVKKYHVDGFDVKAHDKYIITGIVKKSRR